MSTEIQVPVLAIGATVWRFDPNHRIYRRDSNGRATDGPIWREYWRPHEVTGETSRSWILGLGWSTTKLPKRGAVHSWLWAFSKADIDRRAWIEANQYRLGEFIGSKVGDYDLLRQVATLVGFQDKTP